MEKLGYIDPLALVSINQSVVEDEVDGANVNRIIVKPSFSYGKEQKFESCENVSHKLGADFKGFRWDCVRGNENIGVSFHCKSDGMSIADVCDGVRVEDGALVADIVTSCDVLVMVIDYNQQSEVGTVVARCVLLKCDPNATEQDEPYITRSKVVKDALRGLLNELYKNSEPSVSYDELVMLKRNGLITENEGEEPIYKRHKIDGELFEELVDEYKDAYSIRDYGRMAVSQIIDGFNEGIYTKLTEDELKESGMSETQIEISHGYGRMKPLAEIIGKENADKVIGILERYKSNLRCNEVSGFDMAVYLGESPTSVGNDGKHGEDND